MAKTSNGKMRLLQVLIMLHEETDGERGLSMTQIIERLTELGLPADRKTIYDDMNVLSDAGFSVQYRERNPREYYLANRRFTFRELSVYADTVQNMKFISDDQKRKMMLNMLMMGSDGQREILEKQVDDKSLANKELEHTLINVETIRSAINARRKITFTYWKYSADNTWHIQHGGMPYELTPVAVTMADGWYYLTAWSDKHESLTEYRADRMRNVEISEKPSSRHRKISEYRENASDTQYFGRFNGELVTCTLEADESLASVLHDKFGDELHLSQPCEGKCRATVKVRKSPQFFGWIAGLNGEMRICKPKHLAIEYRDYLQNLLNAIDRHD